MKLSEFIQATKSESKIKIFYDIETFQYNQTEGYQKPSKFKNGVYIVGVSYNYNDETYTDRFPNFKSLFDTIDNSYGNNKTRPNVDLISHNGNKYDNHYLRKSLIDDFDMKVENLWINNVENDTLNHNALRLKDLTPEDKQGIILEKRVKSSINLDMIVYFKNQKFTTIDNYIKTNASIDMLGKKLLGLGVITEEETKDDYNYEKYNKEHDMTKEELDTYCMEVYNSLTEEELKYVDNDVIILAKSEKHYSELFHGFEYNKFTFTSNILDSYNNNNLTSFQLLNRIENMQNRNRRDRVVISYTDYQIRGTNFYDWLKPFYRGGLNFYNENYKGQIIEDVFSMDINSSYPYAMHNFKIPTFIESYEEFETPTPVEIITNDDTYTLFQITKEEFDTEILLKIDSKIIRQILVKYYNTNEFININSYTFRMIKNITGLDIKSINALATVTFSCEYFGSRDIIDEFYYIKTQGSKSTKIEYKNPYDITVTNEPNENQMTREEVAHSKVNLNGLYGIPALRPFFNLFRYHEGEYVNNINGFKNNERNIVFSIFVTSVSLWNLLSPLSTLTADEIDENFLYCDTDSLYMRKVIEHKIDPEIFDPNVLGKWDLEHSHISQFYVLNHKKYCYIDEENNLQIKSGGIPLDTFDRDMSFEEFIETQFSHGVFITNLRSIYTEEGTIALYNAQTKLEEGGGYMNLSSSPLLEKLKELTIQDIRNNLTQEEHADDLLFIETPFGTLSKQDIYPYVNPVNEFADIYELMMKQRLVRDRLGM